MVEYLRLVAGGSGSGSTSIGETQLVLIRAGVVAAIVLVVFLVFKRK